MICLISCADDTEVGFGLLNSEDLEVVFEDDFNIQMRHIEPTPIKQFNLPSTVSGYLHSLGTLENEYFGKSTAEFYVIPAVLGIVPDFTFGTLDSAFLALKVDPSQFYGDPEGVFDIEVYELSESMGLIDSVLTNRSFTSNPEPLGVLSRFVPADLDSILTYDTRGDSLYATDVVSIPLNRRFAAGIFIDTANNTSTGGLSLLTNGFVVRATSNNSLLRVDLNNEVSSLLFYYQDSSGVTRNYPYRFGFPRPMNVRYDLESSQLQSALDNDVNSELFFLQGHGGATVEIDVSDVLKVADPFVNHAGLQLFAEREGIVDTSEFALPESLDLYKKNEDGSFEFITDLEIASTSGLTSVFDGNIDLDNPNMIISYEMNITSYIKELFDGEESSKLYLRVRNRVQTPNALIFYGPDHPTHPIKLKLTYTKS